MSSAPHPVTSLPTWQQAVQHTAAIRALQSGDGSISPDQHVAAGRHLLGLVEALLVLAQACPATGEHLLAAQRDLLRWSADGLHHPPDFRSALEALRLEQHRVHGTPLITLLNQYTPNASTDRLLELNAWTVLWTDELEEAARAGVDNPAFVPLIRVSGTSGYDSDCAVLFPETVSLDKAAGPAPNTFGALIASTEARRHVERGMALAERVGFNVAPESRAALLDVERMQDAFALWDYVHDRTHGAGELPFDPFMIRQRAPYFAYALEELRCEVASYLTLRGALSSLPSARAAAQAVLVERMLRFPLTGSRVRNYDGLAGQILFGWLHRAGAVTFANHRLHQSHLEVDGAMEDLAAALRRLYRDSVRTTRTRQWAASHAFISAVVPARLDSALARRLADGTAPEDPREFIALVHPDEFPLSQFHLTLQRLADGP